MTRSGTRLGDRLDSSASWASIAVLAVLSYCTVLLGGCANPPPHPDDRTAAGAPSLKSAGDGQTDATEVIQQAVNSGAGEIRFPRGTYRITHPINIPLDRVGPTAIVADGTARIVMEGPGPAFRFVGTHDGTASPDTVDDRVWRRERAPMVEGLEIVGAHPDACGIEAAGTMQLILSRIVIRRVLHGIHLVRRNRNVIITNSHIYENRGAGIYYDHVNLHQSNIVGCHISYNQQGGVVIRGGDVRNVHIGTCDIEGNMGPPDAAPSANVWLDSTGGSIGEVAITGCTIQHTHDARNSANIRIDGESTSRPFTSETRHGNIAITGNVLSDSQVNIDISNSRGITIVGNTAWKGYQYNLRVRNCDSLVVSDNVFDRNPRYHYGDGAAAQNGLLFERCVGGLLHANQLTGAPATPGAVVLRDCSRFNITDCTLLNCSPCALWLQNVDHSRISDCLIHHDLPSSEGVLSLKIVGGQDNMVVDNLLGNAYEVPDESVPQKGASPAATAVPRKDD